MVRLGRIRMGALIVVASVTAVVALSALSGIAGAPLGSLVSDGSGDEVARTSVVSYAFAVDRFEGELAVLSSPVGAIDPSYRDIGLRPAVVSRWLLPSGGCEGDIVYVTVTSCSGEAEARRLAIEALLAELIETP